MDVVSGIVPSFVCFVSGAGAVFLGAKVVVGG